MTYPPAFTIADERAYIDQAIALSQDTICNEFHLADQFPGYIPKNYPLGTALWSSLFVFLGGKWAVFWSGMTAWLSATLLLGRFLDANGKPWYPALLLLIFPPAIVLSRHVMSELPSMLLITIFLILFLRRKKLRTTLEWISLGALGSSVLFFREANLLLTAPLLLVACKNGSWSARTWLGFGFLLGIVPRLVFSYWFYGDFLYVKDPGLGFSLLSAWQNLPFYLIGLFVFIPLGGCSLFRYRGIYGRVLPAAAGFYLLFHLFYDYSGEGSEAAGPGRLILLLRFIIPSMPLLIWMYADYWKAEGLKWQQSRWLPLLVLPFIFIVFHLDNAFSLRQDLVRKVKLAKEIDPCREFKNYEYCSLLYKE